MELKASKLSLCQSDALCKHLIAFFYGLDCHTERFYMQIEFTVESITCTQGLTSKWSPGLAFDYKEVNAGVFCVRKIVIYRF